MSNNNRQGCCDTPAYFLSALRALLFTLHEGFVLPVPFYHNEKLIFILSSAISSSSQKSSSSKLS